MGIGFPETVRVVGAWVAGQASPGAWARGLRVIGYRGGSEVARTGWFEDIGETPAWFAMDLENVDRIELVARPAFDGAGWYALDDLTYELERTRGSEPGPLVVDFDDLEWRTTLTGSGYAGLTWEAGAGDFGDEPRAIHPPRIPRGSSPEEGGGSETAESSGPGTLPALLNEFAGMRMFEAGTSFIPPDTCGAIGPDHFVSVVNVKLGVFDRTSGARLLGVPLEDFFGASGLGDPRVTYDHHSQRFFLIASSGPSTARIHLAISMSSDPTGPWFKSYIDAASGSDVGRWPDYPTLGFDVHGFYAAALMVPSTMTIWAIDKAPLLTSTPSLGAVFAWRDLPFEGAIQPCATYGDSAGELLVSRRNVLSMRIRQVSGPLTAPTLSTVALVPVPGNSRAPAAPALGSTTDIATGDTRPMNAVYRAGSVFTAHTIELDGRAACRWYELDVASQTAVQVGTIADSVRHYYYPSIAVNADAHIVLGFSGSHGGEFVGAFYTGHHALDPPGATAEPELLRAGLGAYNHVDGSGTNRWGDYSLTSVDPLDDSTLWTIQEYAHTSNRWGTWIGELAFVDPCPSTWTYCLTSPSSVGPGALMSSAGGTSVAANDLVLAASGAPPDEYGMFFYGPREALVFFGDGLLCVSGGLFRLNPPVRTDAFGFVSRHLDLTEPPTSSGAGHITAFSTWYFQFWYRDPASGGFGFNLSDGLGATFCP